MIYNYEVLGEKKIDLPNPEINNFIEDKGSIDYRFIGSMKLEKFDESKKIMLPSNVSIKGDKIIRLVKEKDTISSEMKFVRKVINIAIDKKTILENRIKELSDELSKWKRNRDLVTGRFIKNRK